MNALSALLQHYRGSCEGGPIPGRPRFTVTVALGNVASDRLVRDAGAVLAGQAPDFNEYETSLVPWQEPFLREWLRELDAGLAPTRPHPRG